jgi:hypothetical protein
MTYITLRAHSVCYWTEIQFSFVLNYTHIYISWIFINLKILQFIAKLKAIYLRGLQFPWTACKHKKKGQHIGIRAEILTRSREKRFVLLTFCFN